MDNNYLVALKDSLERKYKVLEEIQRLSIMQSELLEGEEIDYELFDRLVDDKDVCIEKIEKLDDGFSSIYDKVKLEIESNKEAYSVDIKYMQEMIQQITDITTGITAREARNKAKLSEVFNNERRKLGDGRRSVSVAMNYYKNMSNSGMLDNSTWNKKK